jgi:hypothetical protein
VKRPARNKRAPVLNERQAEDVSEERGSATFITRRARWCGLGRWSRQRLLSKATTSFRVASPNVVRERDPIFPAIDAHKIAWVHDVDIREQYSHTNV